MQKPSVGRIVHYYGENFKLGEQPQAAIITFVWSDDLVNLCAFSEEGMPRPKQSVTLIQTEPHTPTEFYTPYCVWPPRV
jgi:hypothetical protein